MQARTLKTTAAVLCCICRLHKRLSLRFKDGLKSESLGQVRIVQFMLEPQLEAQEAAIPLPATRLILPRALRNRALLAMASARLTQAKMQSG